MGFFKKLNAMKVMIGLCLVAAVALGYLGWEQHSRAKDLRDALAFNSKDEIKVGATSLIEEQAITIQAKAAEFSDLTKQLDSDNLRGDNTPLSYIRSVAGNKSIALGGVNINPRTDQGRGYKDSIYTILPKALNTGKRSARSFQRTQLANFMYKLEEGSKRVRVTSFKMDPPKNLKPEDIPTDMWTFQCAVTIRSKE